MCYPCSYQFGQLGPNPFGKLGASVLSACLQGSLYERRERWGVSTPNLTVHFLGLLVSASDFLRVMTMRVPAAEGLELHYLREDEVTTQPDKVYLSE